MTPDDLAAVKARVLAWPRPCGVCMGHSPERDGHDKGCDVPIIREDVPALIAALREAWADNDRIGALVEWQAEVIVDARDACQRAESIEPSGSPEWVESGIAMRTTVLREVRTVLDRERTAHPSALDRVTRERDEAIRHKVELDDQ